MQLWRKKADEMFPELADRFAAADTPYLLWFELLYAFERAYDQTPQDESLIRRIYRYSKWCCEQPRGKNAEDDLLTCVAVCFYEHIPHHANARQDMPRWWRSEDLDDGPGGEPTIFAYHLTADELADFRRLLQRERDRYDPALWDEN